MPTHLTTEQHLEGLRVAMVAFVRYADRAGLEAPVPTCAEWSVRDLVAHQGMVHRWAAAMVRGEQIDDDAVSGFEREGRTIADPLGWLRAGALEVVAAVTEAPEDADATVFLNDAPPPRAFWARRQCHETTIHAVDALAAALGRPAQAEEAWVEPELAADGIDELLAGFLTRPRSRLRCPEEGLLVIAPDDRDEWWELSLGPRPAITTRRTSTDRRPHDPDWELAGGAAELYLRLWNRTAPAEQQATWRALTAVNWS